MTARAFGSSAHLPMKRETVYDQAATGNTSACPSAAATFINFGPHALGELPEDDRVELNIWGRNVIADRYPVDADYSEQVLIDDPVLGQRPLLIPE